MGLQLAGTGVWDERGDVIGASSSTALVCCYLLFYIPGLLIAVVSGAFAAGAAILLKRGLSSPQRPSNQAAPSQKRCS
jgi:hypothetical protein